jgi:hypothetical protein
MRDQPDIPLEADDADLVEQHTLVVPDEEVDDFGSIEIGDADESDVLEQYRSVPGDEEDR